MVAENCCFDGKTFLEHCRSLRKNASIKEYQAIFPMLEYSLPALPKGWARASLSELCERVSVGHVGPTSTYFSGKDQGIPFVRSQDVRPGRLVLDSVAYVRREFHKRLKKSQLKPGDILIVRVGANRGDSCVVPTQVTDLNCANIVFARPFYPNGFIGFFLRSHFGRELLLSLSTGSAQGVLNTQFIAQLPIPIPSPDVQKKIASILSAHDNLIENNLRRIKILGEIAQLIYHEWFVNFRFPGHENVLMVDSPLGKIPEGWGLSRLVDIADFVRGIEPGNKNYLDYPKEGTVPFIRVGDLGSRQSSLFIPEALAKGKFLNKNDIAITLDGTVGIVRMGLVGAYSTGVRKVVIRDSERLSWAFLYLLLRSDHIQDIVRSHAKGTTIQHASSAIDHMTFICPPRDIMQAFDGYVSVFLRTCQNFAERIAVLRSTRDLLLPKLISGELDMSELDINTEGLGQ